MEKPRQISVDTLRNRNRVLVLFSPGTNDSERVEQYELLKNQEAGLAEREIVILEVFEKGTATLDGAPVRLLGTTDLRMRHECRKGEFRAVLIGKDGRTAHSFDGPVEPERLFALIDSMPMRREEIQQRLGGEPYAG